MSAQQLSDGAFAAANKAHFDQEAPDYLASKFACNMADAMADSILRTYDFTPETLVLDFACGPGQVGMRLAPHAKQIIGMDISDKMTELYNKEAKRRGLEDKAKCVLCSDDPAVYVEELDGVQFDVVMVCQAFHHFEDVPFMIRGLETRLKPGGSLIVVDFDSRTGMMSRAETHGKPDAMKEHNEVSVCNGYTPDELKKLIDQSGKWSKISVDVSHSWGLHEMRSWGGVMNVIMDHFPENVEDVPVDWLIARADKEKA